jgi:hypothetical protein
MLVELIDSLINEVGSGINEATIRSRLLSLREQAEAVEARLKAVKLELKQTRANIQRLQENAQHEKIVAKQDSVDEVGVKLLKLLSRAGRTPSLEQMAKHLGIEQVVAQHHANILFDKGMIELVAITPAGAMYGLTPKGTAYIVENKLV